MNSEHVYRNEYKYIISSSELEILQNRIQTLAEIDRHAHEKSYYNVRSLYFDNYENSCFYDNENGVDNRDKYRARIYDGSADRIFLEIKHKERGLGYKYSISIERGMLEQYLLDDLLISGNQVINRYVLLKRQEGLHPVIIVDYDRIPYIYEHGNVRVTFDTNISSSANINAFFDPEILKRPIMPKGQHVMEVKFDGFLPDVIKQILNLGELRRTSFSKYYLCRKYSI